MRAPQLSVVIPAYNEAEAIPKLFAALQPVAEQATKGSYEIIFVDDGSADGTTEAVRQLHAHDRRVILLGLSKNFGKEIALAAGIAHARGQAIMMLAADGQMPAERIPDFIAKWKEGWQVVVGVRTTNRQAGFIKRLGSRCFYALFNRLSGASMVPGASDFRLIDQVVQQEFMKLEEPQSITRGLIDWLGFKRAYINYEERPREHGVAAYKLSKLFRLAAHSFISLSPVPLYMFGYLGMVITAVSFLLGASVFIEQVLLHDPWHWHFTGTAMLSILVLFLVGLILVAQGVLALYISYIYSQSKRRPLFIVNPATSIGVADGKTPVDS